MKKFLVLLLLVIFSVNSAFAVTIVFRLKYKGRQYEKTNAGNEKIRNVGQAYLVFNYNGNDFTFSDPYIVKFWKQSNRKLQKTTKFEGTMDARMVNKARRTFMTLTSNKDDVKEFLILIEPNKMMLKGGITRDYVIPFALEGTNIIQSTDEDGKRIYQSSYVKGKFNRQWSLGLATTDDDSGSGSDSGSDTNNEDGGSTGDGSTDDDEGSLSDSDVISTVSSIQQKLISIGYQKVDPNDTTGTTDTGTDTDTTN